MNKAQKMVKMVELMTRRGGVRASELMSRFDLDSRTLRRYLADLRELDLPMEDEGRSDDRVVSLDPQYRRTGVQLTLAEVLSLHFGRTLFNFLQGTSFAGDMEDALERLAPAISLIHMDVARQLDSKFLAVPEPAKDYTGDASDNLDDLMTALVYNNRIHARYRKLNGIESTKRLEPYTLATFRQALYLFARDVDADVVKTYAVERFTEVIRMRQETFEVNKEWKPQEHLAHAFGIISGPPKMVRLAFVPTVAHYIKERTWHQSQTFKTMKDGRLQLSIEVALTVELATWIQGFGPDVEVLEPPELRERIGRSLRRAAERYK